MATEKIIMPKLGESVTEGTITKWFVKVGDIVQKYDSLAEVLTDKVTAEIPSSFAGKITEIIAQEDETLAVGETICLMEVVAVVKEEATTLEEKVEESSFIESRQQGNKPRYSPAVLTLASKHGISLDNIVGTGLQGRVTRKDILRVIEVGEKAVTKETVIPVREEVPARKEINETSKVSLGDQEIPVTPIRKTIAKNMLRSKQEIPHAWMMIEVDVTNLVNYRNSIKDDFKKREGYPLTYFAFFVKAVAQALKEYPQVNAMWAGEKIIQKKEIHLSMATATEDSLFVPVIKHADDKSIKGIAREISALATKVRTGTLSATDMEGGTFTINNTGTFGSVQSAGIINYPQAAILQVEKIVKRPVVMEGDMIAIRQMVNLCLSLDHRILDGLTCGKFLGRVKEILENITKENTSIY